jgi:hypothetical protein
MVDMAHFAGLVAGGVHPNPLEYAHVATSTTHKTLRCTRGGIILTNDEALAKKFNSAVFPGLQGGPLMHVIAGKAVGFGEALRPEYKAYIQAVVRNAKVLARRLVEGGLDMVSGGTDTHVMLVDLRPKGPDRQHRREEPGARRDHLQQERHPERSGKADGDQRRPSGHARRHDARLRRGGIPRGRQIDRRSPGRTGGESGRQ